MSDRAVHVLRSIDREAAPSSGKSTEFTAAALTRRCRLMKTATRALISGCGGGEGAAATISAATGRHVRQQRMSDCGSMHAPDMLRIDEVAALEEVAPRDAQWPPVTRALATEHGFLLVPLRQSAASGRELHGLLSALFRESGEAGARISESIADGSMTQAEAEACLAEVNEMMISGRCICRRAPNGVPGVTVRVNVMGCPVHDLRSGKDGGDDEPWSQIDRAERDRALAEREGMGAKALTPLAGDDVRGLLGRDVPSGRLFEVRVAPGEDRFILSGLGLALQLDQVTAQALVDAARAGVRHCQQVHMKRLGDRVAHDISARWSVQA